MQTIMVGLASGLIVGLICVLYVFLRSSRMIAASDVSPKDARQAIRESPYSEEKTSSGFMFMAVFGSGSLLWGFIGAGIYHIIRDDWLFFVLSVVAAVLTCILLILSKTPYTIDKIVLSIIIFLGLGFLIPWMI